jgi:cytochrome c
LCQKHGPPIAIKPKEHPMKKMTLRLVPTFRSSRALAAILFRELQKVMGTSKFMVLVPLFDLKSPIGACRLQRRDFKSAALMIAVTSIAAAQGARAQDVAAGEQSFHKCMACHSIGEGAKNKVGPELNGLDGRHSGSAPDYSYSDANKNSGITWNKEQFLEYITDPKAKIPGTKMIFPGIKNEKERNDVWAYISQFDKDGKKK